MWTTFGDFRRSRPFWGGLFTILGGLWIILLPLSPISDLILLGVAGISGALIGIVLVVIGGFVWFSPPNRSLAGVLTLVFSLASFVVSNLGGLIVGMVLGLIGGALTLAWAPDGERGPRGRRGDGPRGRGPGSGPGAAAVVLLAVVPLVMWAGAGHARAEPAPPIPSPIPVPVPLPVPPSVPRAAPLPTPLPTQGLTGLIPPTLLAPFQPAIAPGAGTVVSGLVGDLRMDTLTVTNFQYQGMVDYPVAGGGTQRALHIVVDSTDIGNLRITIPGARASTQVMQKPGSTHTTTTRLVLDCTRLRVTIAGLLTVEFSLDFPPPPLIVIPALSATDVQIDYVLLSTPTLIIPGLSAAPAGPAGTRVGYTGPPGRPTPAQAGLLTELASLLRLPDLLRPYGMSSARARAATRPAPAPVPPPLSGTPLTGTPLTGLDDDRPVDRPDPPTGEHPLLGLLGAQPPVGTSR